MNNVSYEWIRLGMLLLAVLSLPVTGKERSPELWRTYMHGIVPDQAVSISIREIVKEPGIREICQPSGNAWP